ncbi:MAG: TonB-dependent receptor domain-containing protein [Sphingomicrobium sp.]
MRNFDSFSRFTVSVSAIALGAAFAAPAYAQTPPAPVVPPNCAAIQNEAQRQACAQAAEQVDPLANSGEAATTASGAGNADSTQSNRPSSGIVITGSRLRRDERTSADPLTVIDPNVESREGKLNTAEVLQTSPLAAGSTQITSALSSNFVINGGEGVETISLRGLGANRTLVLLNGRRAGPAGVRGGVSSFDLNVIPVEAIQQIDILKTGASSVYGSDAIAGVVNLITKKDLRGLQIRGFSSIPTTAGGDETSLSALFGTSITDRGHIMVGADYYKRHALKRGDRSFLGCEEENVTSEATGERADPLDPRTGEPLCGAFANAQIFLLDFFGAPNLCGPLVAERPIPPFPPSAHTGCGPASSRPPGFTRRPITSIQFNYPGTRLNEFLNPLAPPTSFADLVAPTGFFPVGSYNATGYALQNNYNSQVDQDSIIPRTTRYTIFGEAGYDLTDDINLYFEGLYNRRKTHTVAHRQLFFYQFAGDSVIGLPFYFCEGGAGTEQCDPFAAGDPLNTGFTFPGLLTPVIIAPFDSGTDVKYFRGVAGARADLSKWLPHGFADFYFQHSKSDGDYFRDIIFRDAVEFGVAAFRTDLCAGTVTAIRGVPCMDINYTDPRVLRGEFTPEERNFLFGVDKGNTIYKQDTAELSFGGDLFTLPGGPLKFALGGQWRRDFINDTPGEATLVGNTWGSTSSGVTKGFQRTTEAFGEIEVPLLRDIPGIHELTFNGAARLTNTYAKRTGPVCEPGPGPADPPVCVFDNAHDSDKGNWTYKLAANYAPTSFLRLRATYGTSFRSPALFEQFLANESGFLAQSQIDPCIRYELKESVQLQQNCASLGIPEGYLGAGGSAETFSQGGIGLLDPETSKALTLSAIITPEGWFWRGGQFSFAVDYIDIKVRDQVTQLGAANIVNGCFTSESFPTDPLCDLFFRVPQGGSPEFSIRTVNDPFLNIDTQQNRSLDFTTRFRQNMGNWGTLSILGEATYQLKDRFTLFQGVEATFNGKAGDPRWAGNLNVSWTKDPVILTYGLQVIKGTSDRKGLIDANGQPGPLPSTLTENFCLATASAYALRGGPYCPVYKLPTVAYHSFSAEIQATKNFSFTVGVANIFNKKPPTISTVGGPINTFAQVPLLGSYYDYIGRRVFVTARAKLGDMLGL